MAPPENLRCAQDDRPKDRMTKVKMTILALNDIKAGSAS